MPVFEGNTSTSSLSDSYNNILMVKPFSITNRTGGDVLINVSVLFGSTNILITPYNQSLSSGQMYKDEDGFRLLPGYKIYVLVNGNCDFYFSME